jgi:hypothetical protein
MSEFQSASALSRIADGKFRAQIPGGWEQGRGAFGGLVVGVLARAMLAEADPTRRLRVFTADLCGPVAPGEVDIEVELLRRGANLTNLDARLKQNGAVLARGSGAIGSARAVRADAYAPKAPDALLWTALDALPIAPPLGPVFAQHYEFRSAGPFPFSGGREARVDAFVREKHRTEPLDAPAVLGLLDAPWPTLYSIEAQPRPVATVSFTAELFHEPCALSGAEPLRFRSQLGALEDGFMTEFRELWHGELLVAMNQQTMALMR